jgi:hypothetical protein
MNLFLFLVWLQMSAQPQIFTSASTTTGCINEMTITIPSEDGSGGDVIGICRDNKWHRVPPQIYWIQTTEPSMKVLPWTSAENPDDTPPGKCGHHSDGSITDCCGALMKSGLNQEFAQAAQRAADETDGKPPDDIVFTKWDNCNPNESAKECYERVNPPEPVDVPAVREELESVCWFHRDQPMECTNNGELDWSPVLNGTLIAEDERVRGKNGHRFTCTDKSRVLLTSEDGKKHCVKF